MNATQEMRGLLDKADELLSPPGAHAPEREWDAWYDERDKLRARIGVALEPHAEMVSGLSDKEIVEVAFALPHAGHPGIPGAPEGVLCPRCEAERALDRLAAR